MKTPKPFYKKPLFWLPVILLALLATPSAIKIFELYIYSPQQEPAPEDFYIREEDPPFTGMTPASKEDVEIYTNAEGKTVVEAHRDGYSLVLDPSFEITTRELESGRVLIHKGDACRYSIYRLDGTENITTEDWFSNERSEEEMAGTLSIKQYYIEKIDSSVDAYNKFLETTDFGLQKTILFRNRNNLMFSISKVGEGSECDHYKDIFLSLSLN